MFIFTIIKILRMVVGILAQRARAVHSAGITNLGG